MLPDHVLAVPLGKSPRLMNHGPTVLVSAMHEGVVNVMAAAWACVLDFEPRPKVTLVLDKSTRTRALVEGSGHFALQLPCKGLAQQTHALGHVSAHDMPDKLAQLGVETFMAPDGSVPLVHGCVGWLACKVMPEPHNQSTYDLFIGEIIGAWADSRVFRDGHWQFDGAPDALRTIHYVAGGHFFATGEAIEVQAR